MKAILCVVMIGLCCTLALGQAQYKVLWSFLGTPNDGFEPVSGLVFDGSGNLYGTASRGGSGILPYGIVFELSPKADSTWTETVLYNFCSVTACLDGAVPMAGLVFDSKGNLYGTTYAGGANDCENGFFGCGTVFELSPPSLPGGNWTEAVLYDFCSDGIEGGCKDGAEPTSQLTVRDGKLYGTTTTGGAGGFVNGCCLGGTVFELSPGNNAWIYALLYNFCADGHDYVCPDGSAPQAGVTFDDIGNLYGTTKAGGSLHGLGNGTVYKLSPGADGWTETLLSSHMLDQDGGPLGEVAVDKLDNIYGTFSSGGATFCGGVFRLSQKGNPPKTFSFDGNDGQGPSAGVLLESKTAKIYGTTSAGGTAQEGTVFGIMASGTESVLYNFCSQPGCVDGEAPMGDLITDANGNLYGTASFGGSSGNGVVFEITP
ncbi:MAG TPA: choice-of-anchor tandem repeat GloVer-containing protein [Terriglobales bacterium]|nr:choice-of-anchor tandem repeat GloVer-containing protein [Terriglobales bacterium]